MQIDALWELRMSIKVLTFALCACCTLQLSEGSWHCVHHTACAQSPEEL